MTFLVEGRMLLVLDAVLLAVELVLLGHGQLLGGHEVEGGVEVAHGHQQRVDGAPVFQVAHQIDVQVLQRALRLVDGVEVEHALRGMLVGTVAGIDDGHGGHLGGILRGTLDVVAHHDDVGIVGDHQDGVFQGLALCAAGDLWVGKADDAGTKAVGCRLKRKTGAGGRFKEQGGHHLALQQFAVGVTFKLLCHLNHVENFLSSEVGNRYKIMLFHLFCFFSIAKLHIISEFTCDYWKEFCNFALKKHKVKCHEKDNCTFLWALAWCFCADGRHLLSMLSMRAG